MHLDLLSKPSEVFLFLRGFLRSKGFILALAKMLDLLMTFAESSLKLQAQYITINNADKLLAAAVNDLSKMIRSETGWESPMSFKARKICERGYLGKVALRDEQEIFTDFKPFLVDVRIQLTALHQNSSFPDKNLLSVIGKYHMNEVMHRSDISGDEIDLICKRLRLGDGVFAQQIRFEISTVCNDTPFHSLSSQLQRFFIAVNTLIVSTAECERAFSLMNFIKTKSRNKLLPATVSSLMTIKYYLPHESSFDADCFVKAWIKQFEKLPVSSKKSEHDSTAQTGKTRPTRAVCHACNAAHVCSEIDFYRTL